MPVTLNADQSRALAEILAAEFPGRRHLLTGYAGSGKTTLMQEVARQFQRRGRRIALTAPTHKAVAVLAATLRRAGLEMPCLTIHSLLSLRPQVHGETLKFTRQRHARPVTQDIIVIDEASMLDAATMLEIDRHLQTAFVLFVGDPAQLPPVNERRSQAFETRSHSHLTEIVRQARGNPILAAAHTIRESQGNGLDWSWVRPAHVSPRGVFVPTDPEPWIKRAFTSRESADNPDSFRYLCWTNARVHEVNQQIREWRYGERIPTPFLPGERALVRAPIIRDDAILFHTNEECTVTDIRPGVFGHRFPDCGDLDEWSAEIPSWAIRLRGDTGGIVDVHLPRDDAAVAAATNRAKREAHDCRERYSHLHEFRSTLARLQAIYALTVHNSQGSTFANAFVDVGDIRRRARDNPLETQQLLYVAATRPTQALVLVNV